jgi:glycosyltransferase involved in cell wall biosynthesis
MEGLVAHEQSQEAFADKTIELLLDPNRLSILSKKAREKVKNRFNWNEIAKTML